MIHHLANIRQKQIDYDHELEKIKQLAMTNGYKTQMIDQMLRATFKNLALKKATTLQNIAEPNIRARIPFVVGLNSTLRKHWKRYSIGLECSDSKLSNLLSHTKDKTEYQAKSGIYKVQCSDRVHRAV